MDRVHTLFAIWIIANLVFQNSSNVEGRYHYHRKPKSSHRGSSGSKSPVSSPDPQDPSSPTSPPSVPSDPYPNDPGNSSANCVFDVRSYGAVGDGSNDDTEAFRQAWKEACAVESAVILAPEEYSFIITSTIFSGPCKPGLVFQVSNEIPCSLAHFSKLLLIFLWFIQST